jgi:hypothetical protein
VVVTGMRIPSLDTSFLDVKFHGGTHYTKENSKKAGPKLRRVSEASNLGSEISEEILRSQKGSQKGSGISRKDFLGTTAHDCAR